jgi:hypothetical protein
VVTSPEQPGVLLDPRRHALSAAAPALGKWDGWTSDLADFARRINRVTGTPLLTPAEYALVFQMLEEELRHNPYFLTTTSKAVRDRCIEWGSPIARKAVNFILQGIAFAGYELGENPANDTAANMAMVFKGNVHALCRNAQLELTGDERALLDAWILAGMDADAGSGAAAGGYED